VQATAIVVNQAHYEFYDRLAGVARSSIAAQQSDWGTVPAILYGLRHLANLGRETIVAVFPCDHPFRSDDRFIHHIEEAMAAVEASPCLSVVLGMVPTTTEGSFEWIEPGERVYPLSPPLFRVRRVWEKPGAEIAAKLMLKGCVLNSLVIVASASRLLEMIGECVPALYVAFNAAFASPNGGGECSAIEELYRSMDSCGFSQEVLSGYPPGLAVKRVSDVEHRDLDNANNPLCALRQPRRQTGYSSCRPDVLKCSTPRAKRASASEV